MQTCRSLFVAGILFTVAGSRTGAADWTQFRGSTGDGVSLEAGLPVEWGPSKNVVWKQAIPGSGWSSPVVGNGRVYLTTAVKTPTGTSGDVSLRTLCLNAETGKPVWDTEVFLQENKSAARIHTKNSHASPTPVLCDGRLYVHYGHQGTACLDLEGKVLWRNRNLTYQPVHGNGGSPICVDDLLVYSADGGDTRFVIALDRSTGELRWKTERTWRVSSQFSFSTPLLITVQGRKQIVSPGSNGVVAYDPADGKEIWRVHFNGYSVIPKPVFGNGLLYVCTGYGVPNLLAIRPDGRGDVTDSHVAWTAKKGVPHTPTPVLVGQEIYMVSDSGIASCLDARTGKVHWQERIGGNYSASPIFAAGRIYFQSEDGVGTVLKAGTTFEQLSKNPMNERSLASHAAAGGILYIRTEHNLYAIKGK